MRGSENFTARQERKEFLRRMLADGASVKDILTDFVEVIEESESLAPISKKVALSHLYPLVGRKAGGANDGQV